MYPDNNICSYLKWRGDIDLDQAPFNEVDALVLSIFSYLDLPDIVSEDEKTSTVQEAAKKIFLHRGIPHKITTVTNNY